MRTAKISCPPPTTEYTEFDILGRVKAHKQTTDGVDYTTEYVYNLGGALIEETYPSTRVVRNTLDASGDLAMVQSKKNSAAGYWSYANSFTYNAAGAVTSMQLGNGRWESTAFNSRLQPTEIALGTVNGGYDKLRLQYSYGDWVSSSIDATKNNGNIVQQVITVPDSPGEDDDFTATQKYYYDTLNRIDDATETVDSTQTWRQDFSFDRYGNRSLVEANTTTIPKGCLEGETPVVCTADHKVYNPSANTSDNRLSSSDDYTYDAAGNTIIDAQQRRFIYDGENKQVEVSDQWSVVSGQYWYDGDGKRVKKVVPDTGEVTIFVYDAAGKQIAEYSTIVADTNDAKVAYLTNDHLGSPRINTDADGDVIARHDYHPFGEEISTAERIAHDEYTPDTVRKQFTGYERDNESSLDFAEARMYNFQHGRFTSVDPITASEDIINPQTFNRYAYVGNNPLNITDPTGEIWGVSGTSIQWFDTEEAMKKAGYAAYNLLFAYRTGTNQLVALNATANVAVDVASAAQWVTQEAAWGETAAAIGASASALIGVPVAVAVLVVADILDPTGVHRMGQDLPEPVRDARGMNPKFWDDYLNAMSKLKESNPAAPSMSESSPASPDPQDQKPSTPARKSDRASAAELGFTQKVKHGNAPFNSHGKAVYKDSRGRYLTRDRDSHSGGYWKMFDRQGNRIGTYDQNLNRIGK